jgi:hypothetical protein
MRSGLIEYCMKHKLGSRRMWHGGRAFFYHYQYRYYVPGTGTIGRNRYLVQVLFTGTVRVRMQGHYRTVLYCILLAYCTRM